MHWNSKTNTKAPCVLQGASINRNLMLLARKTDFYKQNGSIYKGYSSFGKSKKYDSGLNRTNLL